MAARIVLDHKPQRPQQRREPEKVLMAQVAMAAEIAALDAARNQEPAPLFPSSVDAESSNR